MLPEPRSPSHNAFGPSQSELISRLFRHTVFVRKRSESSSAIKGIACRADLMTGSPIASSAISSMRFRVQKRLWLSNQLRFSAINRICSSMKLRFCSLFHAEMMNSGCNRRTVSEANRTLISTPSNVSVVSLIGSAMK